MGQTTTRIAGRGRVTARPATIARRWTAGTRGRCVPLRIAADLVGVPDLPLLRCADTASPLRLGLSILRRQSLPSFAIVPSAQPGVRRPSLQNLKKNLSRFQKP